MDGAVRRKAYLVGLFVGIPTIPVIWWFRGPTDAFIRLTYPALTLFLVAVAVGLLLRRLSVPAAERVVLVAIAGLYLLRLTVTIHGTEDLSTVTGELTESTFWIIHLLFVFAYLAFATRVALKVSLALYATCVAIIATRLVPDVVNGVHVSEGVTYLRVSAFLGASIALLYALAHVKEQLAEARAVTDAMTELAHTDELTGLPNRRRLGETLDERVADAQRYTRPVSVLLIDVDGFKQVNDTYGHDVGDRVLTELARALAIELRSNDLLGRWGGEEFLIIAPETTEGPAHQLAERCRAALAEHVFAGIDHPVTISVGVASYRPGDATRDLLKRVDDALYAAKRAGRNRVSVA